MAKNNKSKDKAIDDWLSKSTSNLKSAKILYDGGQWEDCLSLLQQSHEKLFKALQLSLGRMTLKQTKADLRVQKMLGFLPREPRAYRHRTTMPLISDMETAAPFIENFLMRMKGSDLRPQIEGFIEGVRNSRKRLQELKKKPFGLIKTTEQLETEVKVAEDILNLLDQLETVAKETAAKFDTAELLRTAASVANSLGYKVDMSETVSVDGVIADVLPRIRIAELSSLSAGLGTFLDPLFKVTRYPEEPHEPFDENNPYIKNFMGLYGVLDRMLKQSREAVKSPSNINAGR
ncbi:MAG: HEPN domain-containing protein [Candidatus Bathyarchaeia archaeon]